MDCGNCGRKAEKGWKHCPDCGARIGVNVVQSSDTLSGVFREMEEFTRRMGFGSATDMGEIDLSRLMEEVLKRMDRAERSGFSLRVHQRNEETPKVFFRGFGGSRAPSRKITMPRLGRPVDRKRPGHKVGIKLPADTREPETEIIRSGNRLVVDIKMPGVRDAGDIDINELESSIEVKAVAGSVGYFKIIKKPDFSRIIRKRFGGGALRLELL